MEWQIFLHPDSHNSQNHPNQNEPVVMRWSLVVACALGASAADITLQPSSTTGKPVGLILTGRGDAPVDAYVGTVSAIQAAVSPEVSLWVNIRHELGDVNSTLEAFSSNYKVGKTCACFDF